MHVSNVPFVCQLPRLASFLFSDLLINLFSSRLALARAPVTVECSLNRVETEDPEGDNNPPPSLTGCLKRCQRRPPSRAPEISAR